MGLWAQATQLFRVSGAIGIRFLSQEPQAHSWWEKLAGTRPRRASHARLRKWLGVGESWKWRWTIVT